MYSFVDTLNNDTVKYVVHKETTIPEDGDSTYNYSDVDIHVDIDADGDPDTSDNHEVTAKIGEATDYQHIHFGVWAALKAAKASGDNDIADLGIGFVQSIGDGLTGADMPNNGTATYSGNWAAAVQSGGRGTAMARSSWITEPQYLTADFVMDEITADPDRFGHAVRAISPATRSWGTRRRTSLTVRLDPGCRVHW